MITWITSILFWCMPEKRRLGIAAVILSGIGFILDFKFYGLTCIVDLIILMINLGILSRQKGE